MARRKGRRGRGNRGFFAKKFNFALGMGTLADITSIVADIGGNFDEDAYIISIDALWQLRNNTVGEGPLEVGFCHGVYTQVEVDEWQEQSSDFSSPHVNPLLQETQRRKIRTAGSFSGNAAEEVLNNGMPIRTKMKFTIADGESIRMWAYNRAGSTRTTGADVIVSGTVYGRWRV